MTCVIFIMQVIKNVLHSMSFSPSLTIKRILNLHGFQVVRIYTDYTRKRIVTT